MASGKPMAWVERFLNGAPEGERVLDLACGGGRHTRLAVERGYSVTAVDRDLAGIGDLQGHPDVRLVEADLESGDTLPFGRHEFGCVIVSNFLWRPILPAIVEAVRDDGLLIYATFADGHTHADGRPMRADFLLGPNELPAAVAPALVTVAYEHGAIGDGPPRPIVQRIAACGTRHRWARSWPLG